MREGDFLDHETHEKQESGENGERGMLPINNLGKIKGEGEEWVFYHRA